MSFAAPELTENEELDQLDWKSINASGAGLILLVVLMLAMGPLGLTGSLMSAFFVGAGMTLLVWGAVFYFFLRHGNLWIALAAFVLMLIAALAGSTYKFVIERQDTAVESRSAKINMYKAMYGLKSYDPSILTKTPVAMATYAFRNKILADRKDFDDAFVRLNVEQVTRQAGLNKGSAVLDDCGRFNELATLASRNKTRTHAHAATLAKDLAAADMRDSVRDVITKEMDTAKAITLPAEDRLWDLQVKMAGTFSAMCRAFAPRRWVNTNGLFQFTNAGDMNAYNGHVRKLQGYNADYNRIVADIDHQARMVIDGY
jgi:hypothetical protein